MTQVGVHEVKTTLSKLLKRVEDGEEIIISRGGKLVAKLVPVQTTAGRIFGQDAGKFKVPDDLNDPLPDPILDAFEG